MQKTQARSQLFFMGVVILFSTKIEHLERRSTAGGGGEGIDVLAIFVSSIGGKSKSLSGAKQRAKRARGRGGPGHLSGPVKKINIQEILCEHVISSSPF